MPGPADPWAQRSAELQKVGLTLKDFGLDKEDRRARMLRAGEVIVAEWGAIAREHLNTTLAEYLRSISIREVSEDRVVVALPGDDAPDDAAMIARIIEFGMGPGGIGTEGPYDVRKYLLRPSTRNIRWGKTGPYVNVPFGVSAGEIEDYGGSQALKAARQLAGTTTDHRNAKTLWGGRMPARMASKIRAHHTSDALAGMVRERSTYSEAGGAQSTFKKFRRASLNAASSKAWISSGVKAHHFGQMVAKVLPDLLHEVL